MTLQTTTITPKFIDAPKIGKSGKAGPAHIKDENDVRYDFWTRSIPLDAFQRGVSVQIAFEEKQNGQYLNREIKQILESQTRPVAAPAKPQAKELQREKSPKENENIFVNGKLSAAISAGAVEFQEDALVAAGKMLQRVYARLYKPVNIQQTEIEMDDEIPGFGQ